MTPIKSYTWSLWPNSIPIQMVIENPRVLCFGARWVGSNKVIFRSEHHDGRDTMLAELHTLIDQADALLSWNGRSFDTRHAMREFVEAGMTPPSTPKEIDLMRVAKARFKFPSNKLDFVAKTLGVGEKTQHTGFQLWIDCMAGDDKAWNLMRKYQKQDVNLLIDLYEKMRPWIPNHPNVAVHDDLPDGCPTCGSQNLQRRGPHVTAAGKFQRFQCQDCSAWSHSARRLTTTDLRVG